MQVNRHSLRSCTLGTCSVRYLCQRKPNAPQEWLAKLPQMAKLLEESLYCSAPLFEAYNDINTLMQRLQKLAMKIGMKMKHLPLQQPGPDAEQLPGSGAQQQTSFFSHQMTQPPQPYQPQQQPPHMGQMYSSDKPINPPSMLSPAFGGGVPLQQPHLQMQTPQQQSVLGVHKQSNNFLQLPAEYGQDQWEKMNGKWV